MLKWYHPRSGSVCRRFESFYLDNARKGRNILKSSNGRTRDFESLNRGFESLFENHSEVV